MVFQEKRILGFRGKKQTNNKALYKMPRSTKVLGSDGETVKVLGLSVGSGDSFKTGPQIPAAPAWVFVSQAV